MALMAPSDSIRDALEAQVANDKTPGLQYLALDADRTLLEHCAGLANIGRRAPMAPTTTLTAYSMSKTVTAAAVLSLVQAGRLGLDDSLERWVPENPYGPAVLVKHLLAHTSGIPNPLPLRWAHRTERHQTFDEAAALGAVLRDHARLSNPPGAKYVYSNIGYWLLGRIVEAASGETFPGYVREHLLSPLGIEAEELGYAIPDVSRHATGYLEKYSLMNLVKGFLMDRALVAEYEGRWLRINDHYLDGPAFGGLIGTARAFGAFLQDQLARRSRLFDDPTRELLYEPQHILDGASIPMTLGWHVGELGGRRFFFKEGGGAGFHCMMRLYRTQGIATVLMTNATGFDVNGCLNRVDQALVDGRSTS
jgi:CubicO group peptidase (beta-lactamase class C family)